MRRTVLLSVLVLLATGTAAVPNRLSAAIRQDRAPLTLRGVNVISGDHISGMRVRIPTDADVPKDPVDNRNVTYRGRGRVVGLVLVREQTPLRRAYQFVSTRWDLCGARGCSGDWQTSFTHGINWRGRHGYRLPAGDYRLFLIADGAPATVVLRLDGLRGRVSLSPDDDAVARIASPRSIASSAAPNTFFGRARPIFMPSYGLLIDADEHDQSAGARGSGSCYWRADDQEQPHQATPGPHCVTFAERGGNGSSFSTFDRLRVRSVGAVNVPAGDWRSSYWSAFAGASGRSDFLALWLAYAI